MVILEPITNTREKESTALDALTQLVDKQSCFHAIVSADVICTEVPTGSWQIPTEDFRDKSGPSVVAVTDDQFLVVLPERATDSDVQLFAVGTITGTSLDIVLRLARAAWKIVKLEQKTSEQQNQLCHFADQVLHDFAEIDWMKKLVAQLKVCSLSNSLTETAAGLLQPLRELIRAEAVSFVTADHGQPDGMPQQNGSFPGKWIAENNWLQNSALQVIKQYGAELQSQVLVKNRGVSWSDADAFPNIKGFMLIAVRRQSRLAGWIVSLNRREDSVAGEGQALGANAMHTEAEFSTAEAGLLASAASILATHDHNMRLLQGNIRLSIGIIRALANAVDAKDEYTRGHSDRVARMARHLGSLMNLSAKECQRLLMTGLLHDIGKIGIPDIVLQKDGQLTDEEFAVIQKHPAFGFHILKPVPELKFVLPGVLHHHEAFDGSGYPERLAGHDIPYVARILAIVDTYDAMTSDRPYRKGMNFAMAEEKIRDGAGQFWDPQLVNVFLQNKHDFRRICRESRPGHDSFSMVDTRAIVMSDESKASTVFDPGASSMINLFADTTK